MSKVLRFLAWTAVVLAVLVVLGRVTAVRWWQVPINDPYLEASVQPSLEGGDWVLLYRLQSPGYGQLALCKEPEADPVCTGKGENKSCRPRMVIGRILAVGGDTISVEGSSVTRNNYAIKTQQACGERRFQTFDPADESRQPRDASCDREESLSGRLHKRGGTIADEPQPRDVRDQKVLAGHVWLVSDNRQYPYDSRDFGPVPEKDCQEAIVMRLVSRKGFFDADRRLTVIY